MYQKIKNKLLQLLGHFTVPDPVKECEVYMDQGCSHVDGFICDLSSCPIRKEYNERNAK